MPRVMEIVTPLGDDVLLFHGMQAREELSRPGEYRLDLLSSQGDIALDDILGKNVTIKLALPDDSTRYFNGYVTKFSQVGMHGRYHRYTAVVRPWLWFLTRTADCRIFQEMTVPDIVKAVFSDHEAADFVLELTGTYHKWTYCVQYRETDFNFVSRLLEHEGIYYYVRHTDGHNTLVLTDSTSKHTTSPGYEEIPFVAPGQRVRPELEHIQSWDLTREIQPGAYVHDDYDLERPSVELKTKKTLSRSYTPSDYEVFDYPGLYVQKSDGEQFAGVRIDEYGSQFEVSHGTTNSKGVSVGSLFTLQDFPRDDQNCEHLVVAANYDLEYAGYEGLPQGGGTHYRCTFTAMSSAQQFRPRRATPKPFVQGPQTAVVTGPAGDEIHTDKYGRVTVQFHWDRYGKKNQNSSCWIRVSHPWAGKNWGMVAIPRIGQEVIVAFLEGDPDQPIVTGRVYNAEQMPPYALPANKTQTGVKTRSSLNGSASNFNEIRFEDMKGSEQLFIHAEKNQDIEVEADETHSVGNNRKKTIGNDETTKVGANRTEEVGADETITISGNRTEDVSGNETITISGNRGETVSGNETIDIAGNRTETVAGNEGVTVSGNQDLTVSGSQSITVSGSEKETVSGSLSQTVTGGISITTPATMKITATGGLTITAVGGLKVVAPGGVKYIDFEFDKVGSLNRETYGMKFEAFSLKGEASGIAMATNGITMEASKLLNEKASAMVRKGAAQLVACDGPNVAKAGVAIASAACYLFK